MNNLNINLSFRLPLEQSMCESCKRNSEEYFQLKAQIRFSFYNLIELREVKKRIFNHFKNNKNLNKILEIEDKLDIYMRNHSEMEKISSYFRGNFVCSQKKSRKLMGRDNLRSKEIYRYFISIVLYNIKRGTQILFKGEKYIVLNVEKENLVLRDIKLGKKKKIIISKSINYIEIVKTV